MAENVENLLLEHLKIIQGEQSAARDRNRDILTRLAQMKSMIARIGRDNAHAYEEQVEDRPALDALKGRVGRIEKQLELGN